MAKKRYPKPKTNPSPADALQESEEKFKYAFEHSVIGSSITLLTGEIHVNHALCEMLGYSQSELENRTWREVTHPDDIELTQNEINSLLSGEKESARLIKRFIHKNGSIVWADLGSTLRRDQEGSPLYLITTINDITERKQTEAALLESKLTAEQYLNIAAEIIVSLDIEGNITHLNESGYQLLGYEQGLVGKNWFENCVPEEERNEVRRFFGMLKSGELEKIEARQNCVLTQDGDKKMILWHDSILRGQGGGFKGMLSSGEDITERIEMEKALRIALAKYKTLFEYFPLGVTIADESGTILETNPTAEKLLSVTRQEHKQRSIDDIKWRIVRPDGSPMPSDEFAGMRALKEKQLIENVEMGIVKPDHTTIWLSVTAVPLPIANHGVVMTYVDITARKRAEDFLQASLRLSLFAESHTLDELLQKMLDEAEVLTGSQIGFAHFLHADQKTLQLQMWSTNTLKKMCSAPGKGQHYNIDQAGVWVECVHQRAPVIHNDYASLPASRRKGLPEGHAPVIRELVMPVIRGDLIVAVVGVGNKPANYTEDDVAAVSQIANLTWDIIQRKRAEEALKVSERKYRTLHESMIDGFVRVDMKGNIMEYNQVYRDMLGYSDAELKSLTYVDITPQEWRDFELNIVENQILKRGYSDIYEKEYLRKDGSKFPAELHTSLLRDHQGEPDGMWAIVRDITQRKQAEQALESALAREKKLAHTDALTGIHNRRHLYELAARELEVALRYHQPLSIMLFDIDDFKKINDKFGHIVGDQILVQVTQTACAELRSADTIGRYGGEEFVILLPVTNARQAFSLAERIRESVGQICVPTLLGDATVTLSIGIVELQAAQNESLDDLIRRADLAMYAAKQGGRNRTEIFKEP